MKKTIEIKGMYCEKCKERLENAIKELECIKKAKVDLDKIG